MLPHYRPDIDGLRGVAVLSVVAYHAFPEWLTGGFVGVDIFFVISGYVIGSVSLTGLQGGSFSFVDFYARRITRIFPALILVLAAAYGAGWATLLDDELKLLGKHVAASAAFVPNILLWQEAGYFDTSSDLKPLLHLWSLGIEGQFYLFCPIFLFLLWRRRFILLSTTIALALASFALNVLIVHADPVAAFFLPATRLWELLVGVLLACVSLGNPGLARRRSALAAIGAVLIALAVLSLNSRDAFPGWRALLPTLGAAALIAAGPEAAVNRLFLSHRLAVWLGLISYPLYLWHWPLLAFLRITLEEPSRETRLAAVVLSVVLAWLTYRYVERPIRFGRRAGAAALALTMTIVGASGLLAYMSDGYSGRLPALVQTPHDEPDLIAAWRRHRCFLAADDLGRAFAPECTERAPNALKVVLWGDSTAAALMPGLRWLQQKQPYQLSQYTGAGCMFELEDQGTGCGAFNSMALDRVESVRPDIVILHTRWPDRAGARLDARLRYLSQAVMRLRALGVPRVILIGPEPEWSVSLKRRAYEYFRAHGRIPARTAYGLAHSNVFEIDRKLATFSADLGISYASILEILCDDAGCLTSVQTADGDGRLTTFDAMHLSPPAATHVVQSLQERGALLPSPVEARDIRR